MSAGEFGVGFCEGSLCRVQLLLCRVDGGLCNPRTPLGLPRFGRQGDWLDRQLLKLEQRRNSGSHHGGLIRVLFVASDIQIRRLVGASVEDARNSVEGQIRFPVNDIEPRMVRLKEGTHAVEVCLSDRVEFVIVALGAVDRQSEKSLADMFDCLLHPLRPIEQEVVAGEKPGRPQLVQVVRMQLVGSQHQADHLVIGRIPVERFDDPVTPVPDMVLTVPQLLAEPPPVAVPPDVHPMPRPAFPVSRVVEQALRRSIVPLWRLVILEGCDFPCRWGDTDQVQVEPPQENDPRGLTLRDQSLLLVSSGEKCVDRVSDPG